METPVANRLKITYVGLQREYRLAIQNFHYQVRPPF